MRGFQIENVILRIFVVLLGIVVILVMLGEIGRVSTYEETWIDCMPPLTDGEQKLCDEARQRGWKTAT